MKKIIDNVSDGELIRVRDFGGLSFDLIAKLYNWKSKSYAHKRYREAKHRLELLSTEEL